MARLLEFTPLTVGNLTPILVGDALLYTTLGVNIGARKFNADGNPTSETVDAGGLLFGYNTTTVVPTGPVAALLGTITPELLNKSGNSSNDTIRATSSNDIVYWDYATMWDSSLLSVPVGLAVLTRYHLPYADQNAAIEVFDLGDGQDILNLGHSNQSFLVSGLLTDPMEYGFAATAYGGGGGDILWSGNHDDRLYGDGGDDTIDGSGGSDSIVGGAGLDTLSGGPGDDHIVDTADGAIVHGGAGNDTIELSAANDALALTAATAGDGDDWVYYSGQYASISMALGDGTDVFISDATNSPAADSVDGGAGADVISTWDGNDRLEGGDAEDALWGGAGNDTIFGGAGADYLYPGSDMDTVFGGGGHDVLYFGRQDGDGNQYFDLARQGLPSDGTSNTLVVMGVFQPDEVGGDGFDDTQGVYELDGDIMDNAGGDDMVYVSHVSGDLYRLEIVGGGMNGADIEFDSRDVDTIILWDNAAVSGQQQQHYQWDDATDSYVRMF